MAAGTSGSYGELRQAVQLQLQQRFRPEFLNRIDELLIFSALSGPQLTEIVKLLLGDAQRRAQAAFEEAALQSGARRLEITWTAELEKLALETGSNLMYGARPLRRAVQRLFEDALAEFLVSGALAEGGEVLADVDSGDVVLRYRGETLRPACAAVEAEADVPLKAQPVATNNQVPAAVSVS
ncbi:unnamed protein product [Effrenium voratum]|nr:unnamed protein product [Effrenium voratum]